MVTTKISLESSNLSCHMKVEFAASLDLLLHKRWSESKRKIRVILDYLLLFVVMRSKTLGQV